MSWLPTRSTAPTRSTRRRKPAPWKWGSSPTSWCWIAISSRNRPTLWAAPGCSAPSSKARRSTPLPVLRAADPACPQDRLWMLSMPADDREGHDDGRGRRGGRGAGALPGICGDRADEWQCRSLNAVCSGARAVTTISAQRTLDRSGVAAVRTARGQDEQGEFIVERFEAARQHAGTHGPRGQPEEANELERVAIADARRRDAGARGDARHGEAHEVVAEREAPQFLCDPSGRLAPKGLGALESVRLDFVEAEFKLPAFVVERDDLGGGVSHRIEQRGEEGLGAEAPAAIADRPHAQGGRQVPRAMADQAARFRAGSQFHEFI